MDKSEQYILMCEKAEDIHVFRPIDDFVLANPITKAVITVANLHPTIYFNEEDRKLDEGYERKVVKAVWLPRQDQLQQIMTDNEKIKLINNHPITQVNRLHIMMRDYLELWSEDNTTWKPTTMEQWWIVVVMKWSFNKHWDNKLKQWK